MTERYDQRQRNAEDFLAATATDDITHFGYLTKKGGKLVRRQQMRWFELYGSTGILKYYEHKPSNLLERAHALGQIELAHTRCVEENDDKAADAGHTWTIVGLHLPKNYTLTASSKEEKASWMRKIEVAAAKATPEPSSVEGHDRLACTITPSSQVDGIDRLASVTASKLATKGTSSSPGVSGTDRLASTVTASNLRAASGVSASPIQTHIQNTKVSASTEEETRVDEMGLTTHTGDDFVVVEDKISSEPRTTNSSNSLHRSPLSHKTSVESYASIPRQCTIEEVCAAFAFGATHQFLRQTHLLSGQCDLASVYYATQESVQIVGEYIMSGLWTGARVPRVKSFRDGVNCGLSSPNHKNDMHSGKHDHDEGHFDESSIYEIEYVLARVQKGTRAHWAADANAVYCAQRDDGTAKTSSCPSKTKFSFFKPKHHCRFCGQIFCGRCCPTIAQSKPTDVNVGVYKRLLKAAQESYDEDAQPLEAAYAFRVCLPCARRMFLAWPDVQDEEDEPKTQPTASTKATKDMKKKDEDSFDSFLHTVADGAPPAAREKLLAKPETFKTRQEERETEKAKRQMAENAELVNERGERITKMEYRSMMMKKEADEFRENTKKLAELASKPFWQVW